MSDIEKLDYVKTLPGVDDLECELNGIKMKFKDMLLLMEKDIEIEREKIKKDFELKTKIQTKIKDKKKIRTREF